MTAERGIHAYTANPMSQDTQTFNSIDFNLRAQTASMIASSLAREMNRLAKVSVESKKLSRFDSPFKVHGDTSEYIPLHDSYGSQILVLNLKDKHRSRKLGPQMLQPSGLWSGDKLHESMEEKEKRILSQKAKDSGLTSADGFEEDSLREQYHRKLRDDQIKQEALQLLFRRSFDFQSSDHPIAHKAGSMTRQPSGQRIQLKISKRTSESLELQSAASRMQVHPTMYSSIEEMFAASRPTTSFGNVATIAVVTTKMKDKLNNLGKFVASHAYRKLQATWNVIEARFQQSHLTKTVMEGNEQGLLHPVKYRALKCSSLIGVLCSNKVRLRFNELNGILNQFGYTQENIILGRKISAARTVLAGIKDLQTATIASNSLNAASIIANSTKHFEQVAIELKEMLKQENSPLVSVLEFKAVIFPPDSTLNSPQTSASDMNRSIENKLHDSSSHKANAESQIHEIIEENLKLDREREDIEKKRRQTLLEFDQEVKRIHPKLERMSLGRHDALRSLIEYCERAVSLQMAEKDITVNEETINLLGLDAFPEYIQKAVCAKKAKTKGDLDRIRKNRGKPIVDPFATIRVAKTVTGADPKIIRLEDATVGFQGKFRLQFAGILYLMREMILNGRSLYGYSYSEIGELLQAYASTRIQAIYRGYRLRWRYRQALQRSVMKLRRFAWSHFHAWRIVTKHNLLSYKFCYRKFVAWRYYVKRMKRLREFFRCMYWPFHVWRRTAIKSAIAKEKSRFLTSRVLPTLTSLHIFHAWRDYVKYQLMIRDRVNNHRHHVLTRRRTRYFRYLLSYTKRNRRLRRAWNRSSLELSSRRKVYDLKNNPILIWKVYVHYQHILQARVKKYAMDCRNEILPDYPPMEALTTAERRERHRIFKRKMLMEELREIQEHRDHMESKDNGGSTTLQLPWELRRVSSTSDESKSTSYKPRAKVLKLASLMMKSDFQWKHLTCGFEEDSDDEDTVQELSAVSETIAQIDKACGKKSLEKIPGLETIPYLRKQRGSTISGIGVMVYRLCSGDMWNIFEGAMRFHRFAARCFKNLRSFALIRRNQRISQRKVDLARMRLAFSGFVAWVERDPEYVTSNEQQTESELLANAVRKDHRERQSRRREAIRELEKFYGRFPEQDIYADAISQVLEDKFALADIDDDAMSTAVKVADPNASQKTDSLVSTVLSKTAPSILKSRNRPRSLKRGGIGKATNKRALHNEKSLSPEKISSDMISRSSTAPSTKSKRLIKTPDSSKAKRSNFSVVSTISQKQSAALDADIRSNTDDATSIATTEVAFNPPNLLSWDREDRAAQMKWVRQIRLLCQGYRERVIFASDDSDLKTIAIQDMKEIRDHVLGEIMKHEDEVTAKAIENELDYVTKFYQYAGAHVVTVLDKILQQVKSAMNKAEMKKYFRALRLPMLERRSESMLKRKRIANWIRICRRLLSMEKRAPHYHRMRLLWVSYRRWIKYLWHQTTDPTPNFLKPLKRRCELYPKLSDRLRDAGFHQLTKIRSSQLAAVMTDLKTIFFRWLSYVQETKLLRLMEERVVKLYRLKLMQKCYRALRTNQNLHITRNFYNQDEGFLIRRVRCDLDHISRHFISRRKKALTQIIRRYNRKNVRLQKKQGKEAMSFKRFLSDFQIEIAYRLVTELRILAESFDKRGDQVFTDYLIPDSIPASDLQPDEQGSHSNSSQLIPLIMRHLDGSRVADPAPMQTTLDIAAAEVPSGYQLRKLSFNISETEGILGWQLLWTGDGVPDIESPQRGRWLGHHIIQEIAIQKDDFAIGLEYSYAGTTITALRVKLLHAGWSKWIGPRAALASTTIYLDSNMRSVHEFDDNEYERVEEIEGEENRRDLDILAIPRSYIIGLSGLEMSVRRRCSCIGIVVRKVEEQHIFSYHWVQDALTAKRLLREKEEQAAAESMKALAIALPPIVSTAVTTTTDDRMKLPETTRVDSAAQSVMASRTSSRRPSKMDHPSHAANDNRRHSGNEGHGSAPAATSISTAVTKLNVQSAANHRSESMPMVLKQNNVIQSFDYEKYSARSSAWDALDDGQFYDGSDEGSDLDSSPPSPVSHHIVPAAKSRRPSASRRSSLSSTKTHSPRMFNLIGAQPTMQWAVKSAAQSLNGGIKAPPAAATITATTAIAAVDVDAENQAAAADDDDTDDDLEEKPIQLSSSEEQFFDMIRMRTAEIKVAQIRVERFARNLWTSASIRRDRQLSKLTDIKIIAGLTRWFFESLTKRLVRKVTTEQKGIDLLGLAHVMRVKAEIIARQRQRVLRKVERMENTPQPWQNKELLSPMERIEKNKYKESVIQHHEHAKGLLQQHQSFIQRSKAAERHGKLLLPRIHLSRYICNNIWLKVAAARTKESLMERVSFGAIKTALCGDVKGLNKHSGLSATTFASVKATLVARRDYVKPAGLSLEDIVEEEMALDRLNRLRLEQEAKAAKDRSMNEDLDDNEEDEDDARQSRATTSHRRLNRAMNRSISTAIGSKRTITTAKTIAARKGRRLSPLPTNEKNT
jgi:hypothetical protein